MSASPEQLRLVRQWVEKAQEDITVADRLLASNESFYSTICFHAQQCAEKYIKALLTARGIPFPKSHEIGELSQLLPAEMRPPLSAAVQEQLTDYATVSRYPGDDVVTRQDAEEAVAAARTVRMAVSGFLPKAAVEGLS